MKIEQKMHGENTTTSMRRLFSIMFLAFLLFTISGCNASKNLESSALLSKTQSQLTQKEKIDDFEYLYKILKENYTFINVNKRINGIDWLNNKDKYMKKVKATKSDEDFYKTLNAILKELHNGHTEILNIQEYIYFKNLYSQDIPWANQLNNSKAISRYSKGDSSESSKKPLNSYEKINVNFIKVLRAENKNNSISKKISTYNVKTKILSKERKIAYIKISSFDAFKINEDMNIIKPFFNSINDYKTLIIDIRGNGGGADAYWEDNIVPMLINKPLKIKYYYAFRGGDFEEDFIKFKLNVGYQGLNKINLIISEKLKNLPSELTKKFEYYYIYEQTINPCNSINFSGKVFLLTDKGVGSSADGFASFSKSTGFATLVGEKTFGGGIGLDPLVCVLPNSGYVFRFPMAMGLTSDGTCNEEYKTVPDIEISQAWYSNVFDDKAVKYILVGKTEIISIKEVIAFSLIILLIVGIIYFKRRLKYRKKYFTKTY